jgi:hypothetical protein
MRTGDAPPLCLRRSLPEPARILIHQATTMQTGSRRSRSQRTLTERRSSSSSPTNKRKEDLEQLLYRRRGLAAKAMSTKPHHPQHLHSMTRSSHTETKKRLREKSTKSRPPPPSRPAGQEHERSPNRQIREHQPSEASWLRQPWQRRDGEEAPATLFHSGATTTTLPAPPGSLTLLSTSLRHRSKAPHSPAATRAAGEGGGRRSGRQRSKGSQLLPFLLSRALFTGEGKVGNLLVGSLSLSVNLMTAQPILLSPYLVQYWN